MNNVEWTSEWLIETIKLLRAHGNDTQFIEVKKLTKATTSSRNFFKRAQSCVKAVEATAIPCTA